MAAWWPYLISVSGWHGFGIVTQVCFGISISNFMCMSFVAVGRSRTIVSYVAFKMASLWFWTMFNCNPPIAHCHSLLWGGGILVDHWSTIYSFDLKQVNFWVSGNFLQNAWEEWLTIWHIDVSWLPFQLLTFWSWSVDFPHFGRNLTYWNKSYFVVFRHFLENA